MSRLARNSPLSIEVKNVSKRFGSNLVLDNINIDIPKEASFVIIGGSGSGKSVLIKTIIGLISPDLGTIKINNQDISTLSKLEKFGLMADCGFLFQGSALLDSMTVQENIVFYASRLYNLDAAAQIRLAKEKLEIVCLSDKILSLYPFELSGGMQKRVGFARAIATNPKIIFFDEPTTGLDPITSNIIIDLITNTRKALNATAVTITHDLNCLSKIATHVAMIYRGKIIWLGTADEAKTSDNEYLLQFLNGSPKGPIQV